MFAYHSVWKLVNTGHEIWDQHQYCQLNSHNIEA